MLDECEHLSRLLLKDIEADVTKVEGELGGLFRTIEGNKRRLQNLRSTQKRLEDEVGAAAAALEAAMQDQERASKEAQALDLNDVDLRAERLVLQKQIEAEHADLERLTMEMRRLEKRRVEMQQERQRLEKERLEKERLEKQQLEKQRLERERLEEQRLEKERLEKQRLEKERLERTHAQIQAVKHAESTSLLGQLEQELSQKLEAMAAADPMGLRKPLHVMGSSILSFLLMVVRRLRCMFTVPNDDGARGTTKAQNNKNNQEMDNQVVDNQAGDDQKLHNNEDLDNQEADSQEMNNQDECNQKVDSQEVDKQEVDEQEGNNQQMDKQEVDNHEVFNKELDDQEMANQEAAINGLRRDIEKSKSRLQRLEKEERININHSHRISEQRKQAMKRQRACEALQQRATLKQSDAATYKGLAEAEQSSLSSLHLEQAAIATKLQALAAHRELFAFWSSALAKRTRRGSSPPPSSAKKAALMTNNFREHILVKSLSELNSLLMQAVTVLYDDETRDMETSSGMMMTMLRSLFDSSSDSSTDTPSRSSSISEEGSTIPILDPKLAIHSSLSYPKRSSGERKRVDLALFFALLQLARARSAHRAHYVLVDEVFDSLDRAGQAAVVRWCGVMSRAVVGWIVVITHSQVLVEQQRELGEEDAAKKVLVVEARMGKRGTELVVNGRGICGDGKVEGG